MFNITVLLTSDNSCFVLCRSRSEFILTKTVYLDYASKHCRYTRQDNASPKQTDSQAQGQNQKKEKDKHNGIRN